MKRGKDRAAPLSILGPGKRGRKPGAAGTVGETQKQSSQRRGSLRVETSDAADPGGARVSRGGRRSHPRQHPPGPSPPRRGGRVPLCSYHEPGLRAATVWKFRLQRPSRGEFGVPCAHAPAGEGPEGW